MQLVARCLTPWGGDLQLEAPSQRVSDTLTHYAKRKKKPDRKVWLFDAGPDQLLTRLRYSFVRVSISILSPMAQNSGTFSS